MSGNVHISLTPRHHLYYMFDVRAPNCSSGLQDDAVGAFKIIGTDEDDLRAAVSQNEGDPSIIFGDVCGATHAPITQQAK